MSVLTTEIKKKLEQEVLALGGFRHQAKEGLRRPDLGLINQAFPGGLFPVGAVHEFLPENKEQMVASQGFLSAVLPALMGPDGLACWITAKRELYPPGLARFGLAADKLIFLELPRAVDRLWALEEMLRSTLVSAVVAETDAISFVQSRRFQLAVEASGGTGFLLRSPSATRSVLSTIASWKISAIKSRTPDGLPGVGFPGWRVEILKARNGRAGVWELFWEGNGFACKELTESGAIHRLKKII